MFVVTPETMKGESFLQKAEKPKLEELLFTSENTSGILPEGKVVRVLCSSILDYPMLRNSIHDVFTGYISFLNIGRPQRHMAQAEEFCRILRANKYKVFTVPAFMNSRYKLVPHHGIYLCTSTYREPSKKNCIIFYMYSSSFIVDVSSCGGETSSYYNMVFSSSLGRYRLDRKVDQKITDFAYSEMEPWG